MGVAAQCEHDRVRCVNVAQSEQDELGCDSRERVAVLKTAVLKAPERCGKDRISLQLRA